MADPYASKPLVADDAGEVAAAGEDLLRVIDVARSVVAWPRDGRTRVFATRSMSVVTLN